MPPVKQVIGSVGTCRHCGAAISFCAGIQPDIVHRSKLDDLPEWIKTHHWYGETFRVESPFGTDHWETAEHGTKCEKNEWNLGNFGHHQPKEFCYYSKQDGELCGRATDRDAWLDGMFACGIHIKKAIEEHDRMLALRKREEERLLNQELAGWKADELEKCLAWLERTGFGSVLFPDIKLSMAEFRQYSQAGFKTKISIDIIRLTHVLEYIADAHNDDSDAEERPDLD